MLVLTTMWVSPMSYSIQHHVGTPQVHKCVQFPPKDLLCEDGWCLAIVQPCNSFCWGEHWFIYITSAYQYLSGFDPDTYWIFKREDWGESNNQPSWQDTGGGGWQGCWCFRRWWWPGPWWSTSHCLTSCAFWQVLTSSSSYINTVCTTWSSSKS